MPKYGRRSKRVLSELHPDLRRLFERVIEDYDCSLICGHRSQEDQHAAFVSGASQVPWPESRHNTEPSTAVDAVPYPLPKDWGDIQSQEALKALRANPELTGKELEKFRHFAFYVLGMAAGLGIKIRWGGDWDSDKDISDQKWNDLPHFELMEV